MLKPKIDETTNDEIKRLKKLARKTRNIRMKERYDTIRLWLNERSITEISEILNISYHTARNYIVAYMDSGIEGLAIKTSPGRKTKLTEEQEKALYECIVNKMPADVGFEPFVNWTAPLACLWVEKEFSVVFSERGMRDVFYRLGLSYTRPTYVLKKADLEEQEAFKAEFEVIKKN